MSRMKILTVAASILAVSGLVYIRFLEPGWIKVKKTGIDIMGVAGRESPGPIRILHLTDLHLSPEVPIAFLVEAFRTAVRQQPDLICLTGDYVTRSIPNASEYSEALRILSRAAPTLACPGNHDGGLWAEERGGYASVDEVKAVLENSGIIFLENRAEAMVIRGTRVLVAGVGDIWADRCRPGKIAPILDSSTADLKILLTHNPDSKSELMGLKWDLLLAGHTHGGQFKAPFLGTPFAPVRDKRFISGLYEFRERKIHVSPGVGNLHGLRINCRPEISVLEVD